MKETRRNNIWTVKICKMNVYFTVHTQILRLPYTFKGQLFFTPVLLFHHAKLNKCQFHYIFQKNFEILKSARVIHKNLFLNKIGKPTRVS